MKESKLREERRKGRRGDWRLGLKRKAGRIYIERGIWEQRGKEEAKEGGDGRFRLEG